jgi:hypothetical protein
MAEPLILRFSELDPQIDSDFRQNDFRFFRHRDSPQATTRLYLLSTRVGSGIEVWLSILHVLAMSRRLDQHQFCIELLL